jgi:Metallo-beta-lactamase superfamily
MIFRALPVNNGDAFLLEAENKIILVDGGQNKANIIKVLNQQDIKVIDILICTHYDADHWNGVRSVLKSDSIEVKEVWLPDVVGVIDSLLSSFSIEEFLQNIFNCLKKSVIERYRDEELNGTDKVEFIKTTQNKLKTLHWVINKSIANFPFFSSEHIPYEQIHYIKKAINLLIAVHYSQSCVRWFKYSRSLECTIVSNMVALNCKQVTISGGTPEQELKYLTKNNKESLVFKFDSVGLPNVLFCADSDLSFCKPDEQISLKDNSVITAPHHGSKSNDAAYSRICGNDLMYIRSGKTKDLSTEFTSKTKRWCCRCNRTPAKLVGLTYGQGKWTTNSVACSCN